MNQPVTIGVESIHAKSMTQLDLHMKLLIVLVNLHPATTIVEMNASVMILLDSKKTAVLALLFPKTGGVEKVHVLFMIQLDQYKLVVLALLQRPTTIVVIIVTLMIQRDL